MYCINSQNRWSCYFPILFFFSIDVILFLHEMAVEEMMCTVPLSHSQKSEKCFCKQGSLFKIVIDSVYYVLAQFLRDKKNFCDEASY